MTNSHHNTFQWAPEFIHNLNFYLLLPVYISFKAMPPIPRARIKPIFGLFSKLTLVPLNLFGLVTQQMCPLLVSCLCSVFFFHTLSRNYFRPLFEVLSRLGQPSLCVLFKITLLNSLKDKIRKEETWLHPDPQTALNDHPLFSRMVAMLMFK